LRSLWWEQEESDDTEIDRERVWSGDLILAAYSSLITKRILRIMFPIVNSEGATKDSSFPIALKQGCEETRQGGDC
jgi:hypothetical protein